MKNITELPNLMAELLEVCPDLELNLRGIEIINEIADYAEQTRIFKEKKERGEIFDGQTAKNIFCHMLDRIENAPTTLHRDSSVIPIMPFIRKRLNGEMTGELTSVLDKE